LSGSAPEAFTELLAYDCRLMNTAASKGRAAELREWMTDSDEWLSPQAAVLSPQATIAIASAIVGADGEYLRTIAAGRAAIKVLRDGVAAERLRLSPKETQWLNRLEREIDGLPEDEGALLAEMSETYCGVFSIGSYGLE
jgi:methanol--5-hydroxybenzimidazolylcobamide Co-methyltransferase